MAMIRKLPWPGLVCRVRFALLALAFSGIYTRAQSPPPVSGEPQWLEVNNPPGDASQEPRSGTAAPQTKPQWSYGGFIDLGYLLDFNHPSNHLFRNRATTPRVDELDLNMAALYLTKGSSDKSRWGMEPEAQAGEDSKTFGFSATAQNLGGANWLRQIGKADLSYFLPLGKGLTVQGGIFSSFIGYDSLYARDNFTYTRPWGG